tara:strand:+ start:71 stop:331 length:261 start_codon:yes stop_codon:yes gene_type:complete
MARIKIQDMGISIIPESDPELVAQVNEVIRNGEGEIDVEALKVFAGPYRKIVEAPEPAPEPEPVQEEFEEGVVEEEPKPKSKKKKK